MADETKTPEPQESAPETPFAEADVDARDLEIAMLKDEVAALKDRLLRTAADMDNLRKRAEREKVRAVASDDRDRKAAEIKDRLAQLTAERAKLAAEVPGSAMATLELLVSQRGDDAMAPIEERTFEDGVPVREARFDVARSRHHGA